MYKKSSSLSWIEKKSLMDIGTSHLSLHIKYLKSFMSKTLRHNIGMLFCKKKKQVKINEDE